MSHLISLNQDQLKGLLFELMDEVTLHLKNKPDVDAFLDKTDLFDEWERILPEAEYPIFIMAVLNNIRRESVINSILNAIHHEKNSTGHTNHSTVEEETHTPHPDDHPFS